MTTIHAELCKLKALLCQFYGLNGTFCTVATQTPYQAGLKNLLDVAVLEHIDVHEALQAEADYRKIDEIPFDFERRRISVVVEEKSHHHELICKGAVEEVRQACTQVQAGTEILSIDQTIHDKVAKLTRSLNEDGFRVVAVAYKELPLDQIKYGVADERNLILMGFIAFLDPPKDSAAAAIKALDRHGMRVKVLTGDNEIISRKICKDVRLYVHHIPLGSEIEKLSDAELTDLAETTTVFAKLAPMQKARVIEILRRKGHTYYSHGKDTDRSKPSGVTDAISDTDDYGNWD